MDEMSDRHRASNGYSVEPLFNQIANERQWLAPQYLTAGELSVMRWNLSNQRDRRSRQWTFTDVISDDQTLMWLSLHGVDPRLLVFTT